MDESLKSARQCAISYIGISNKTSGKVREYLLRKGYSLDISEHTVADLIQDGYIRDRRAAEAIVRTRSGRRAEGKAVLLRRILAAGIPDSIAKEVISDSVDDSKAIVAFIESTILPTYTDAFLSDREGFMKWYQKSMRKLMAKGFSADLSSESLRNSLRDVE